MSVVWVSDIPMPPIKVYRCDRCLFMVRSENLPEQWSVAGDRSWCDGCIDEFDRRVPGKGAGE